MGLSQSKIYRRMSYNEKGHNPAHQGSFRHRSFEFRDLILVACAAVAGTLASLLLFSFLYSWLWPSAFIPDLPFNTLKTWIQNDDYVESADWAKKWNALMPHDMGFVEVPDPSRYGLIGGFPLNSTFVTDADGHRLKSHPGSKAEAYCLSVMHQLHCLTIIKEQFEKYRNGAIDSTIDHHTPHCFDYLRQAVMCSADMSLERASLDDQGNIELAVDGWGNQHKCRSWEAVQAFAARHGITTGRGGSKLEGFEHMHEGHR
ncbi:unnamed protein product [Cercospora beticola]|nr:unnamed protein product [Cercospora beticola]